MASVAAFLGLSFLAWSSPLAGEDLLVSRWSLAEGLPQSSPNALAVGPGGYLWVGTEQGLARFDGIRFRVWDTRDGLPGERVVALEATEAGVWVATTPGGLSRLRGGRIEPVLRDVTVFDLAAGADGVWLAAREGLFWVGEDGGVQRMDLPGGAGEASVLLPAADGTLWVGHAEGISRHTPDGGWRDLPTADLEAPITGLAGDERSLWAAARDGFWHREDGAWRRILYAREVKPQVATDPAGDTWLWSRDGGLRRFYRGEVERVPALDELEGWHVFDVVPEGDTTVWVGLGGEGLVRLRRPLFQTVTTADGLAVPAVHGVIEGRDGSLWLGSLEAGVTRLRGGEMRRFGTAEGLPAPAVWALGLDSTGRVWVGTPRGLAYEDGERFRIAEAVAATPIHGLAPGDDGSMYYSAGGGAFHVAGDVVREVVPPQTLRRGGGLLFRTRDRDLWLGGEGACRWRRGELRCFSEAEGLPPDLVRSAWQSPVGEIWLGTYGGGLCRFREPAHFDCLSEDRGLPHRTVHAIVPDRLGWLWLPSNRGLGRARLEDVERALQDPAATIRADVFGLEDGLPDLELNGGVPPGGVALEDGRLAMATMGGLALVDPDRVVARVSAAPIVHLEAVEVDGRPLDPAATLDVGAGSDRVTFHYTGIYPRAPESLRFRYRLAPHDDE
ncbi:MAG: two-component regulator propeller domain-containing protein, partial [Thermoanaerobaculia bacterium]|nr:two-component regulator propeller domain-containing protein [Thermoanaerobaculia bacterium]